MKKCEICGKKGCHKLYVVDIEGNETGETIFVCTKHYPYRRVGKAGVRCSHKANLTRFMAMADMICR